ncbi:MAG: glycosyltransferase [Dehalococcoidia bacterium]|nr:MAG: glycosyltransferase [Dehalococcoidia bacterium]
MISVIVAAYNCEQYIEKALQSVFSQTLSHKHYEVIVVNDGSTDNTLDILNKYSSKIKLISQPNNGLAAACNRGIGEAKGDYVIRLDADDYLDKRLLSSTLKILESVPDHHCVYTDRYEINESDNTKVRVSVGQDNIFDMTGCGILFRREVFDKIGLYRDLLFEEYDLMLRFYDNGLQGYYLQEPLYYYLKHESGMTSQPNYWENGWQQLADIWGKEKLKKYTDIQLKAKGKSRFPAD